MSDRTNLERQKRYKERVSKGFSFTMAEMPDSLTAHLIRLGYLAAPERHAPHHFPQTRNE